MHPRRYRMPDGGGLDASHEARDAGYPTFTPTEQHRVRRGQGAYGEDEARDEVGEKHQGPRSQMKYQLPHVMYMFSKSCSLKERSL